MQKFHLHIMPLMADSFDREQAVRWMEADFGAWNEACSLGMAESKTAEERRAFCSLSNDIHTVSFSCARIIATGSKALFHYDYEQRSKSEVATSLARVMNVCLRLRKNGEFNRCYEKLAERLLEICEDLETKA